MVNTSKIVAGVATAINGFFEDEVLEVSEKGGRTNVRLKGNSIGVDELNFGIDFESTETPQIHQIELKNK